MKRLLSSLAVLGAFSANCYAEKEAESGLLLELQQDLEHYSDIATETKQNVDYMPYVISTLHSDDLVNLGVLNLREAIGLIPGVDLNVGMAGVKNPIFRGSNPYAFGQSRLIIDGMIVNDQIFGGYNQFLELPIDIIHRIEVVRGPGSLLTHVNGYAGSIHVITKSNRDDGQKVADEGFVYAGSDGLSGGGLINSFELENGKLSSDIYYQKHDLSLPVGIDRFGNSGDSDQSLDNYQLGINYQNNGLTFKGRISNNESGVSYGQAFSLTDDKSDFLDVANNSFELQYVANINEKTAIELTLDYFDEDRELQNKVMPDGAMIMMPPPPAMLPDGRYFLVDYNERSLGQRIQLNMNFSNAHQLKIGLHAQQSEITKNNASISNDNLQTFNTFNLFSNNKRNINTAYIEDMFDFGDKNTAQIGAKLSQYNDADDQYAIRLALVHRYSDEDIFKAMFSQAYRESSWREQYLTAPAFFKPNILLDVEKVDAYEIAYIKKISHRNFFKVNAFYLENSEQIDAQNTINTFNNTDNNDLHGIEIEYETDITNNDVLHINYSYIEGSNVSGELANSAQNLAQIYYIYHLSEKWSYSGLLKYTGEKERVEQDTRDKVDAYSLLDLTLTYKQNRHALTFNASVNNFLDETYYLPSPQGTYPDDFEQQGRTFMLRLSKRF